MDCECDLTVYFTTGFEYRLGTNYVASFGGEEDGMWDLSEITWQSPAEVYQKLQEFQDPLPAFVNFEKTVEGTQALYDSLQKYGHSKFRFGCILYHQLVYTPKLKATVQTGRCHLRRCWHAYNP